MDFEPHTCQSSIFFPTQVKLLVLLLPQCNQIARSAHHLLFFLFKNNYFGVKEANKVHWSQWVSNPDSHKEQSSADVSVHAPSWEGKTQIFSLCMFIGVQRGNKIHRVCCCSFKSLFQKARHNRINKEFLTTYHQFWENVPKSQQMCLMVDLWT